MAFNVLPSDQSPIIGVINPQSTNTTVVSGWIPLKQVQAFEALILAGALGASATVDAKLQQATSSGGAGAKDITGKAITQLTKAGTDDNKQAVINCRADELDVNNDFNHVQLSITVGTAASLVAGVVLATTFRYDPSDIQATTVDEVVS